MFRSTTSINKMSTKLMFRNSFQITKALQITKNTIKMDKTSIILQLE